MDKITLSKDAYRRANYRISGLESSPNLNTQWHIMVQESQKPDPLTGWVRVWEDGHIEWYGDKEPCDLDNIITNNMNSRVVFMKESHEWRC